MSLVHALSIFVVAWTALALLFTLVALVALVALGRPRDALADAPGVRTPVLLVRPLDAPTALERANLATPVDYAGPLEHVVASPEAPEGPVPGVRWIASDPKTPNRKVGHVLEALRAVDPGARAVLVVDADVRVDGALVRALVAPLARGAALVSAAPDPLPARGLAARATRALLRATHQSFVALDAVRAGAPSPCGKALALGACARRELAHAADVAGEDLELGRRLHARGLRVVLAGAPARVPQPDDAPLAAPLARFARWMNVLRAHRPALFPAVPLLFAPTAPLALAALALAPYDRAPLAALLALVAARTALAIRLARAPDALAWPLGEALLLAAWLRALAGGRTIAWRGRTFRVDPGGGLVPLVHDAPVRPLR